MSRRWDPFPNERAAAERAFWCTLVRCPGCGRKLQRKTVAYDARHPGGRVCTRCINLYLEEKPLPLDAPPLFA